MAEDEIIWEVLGDDVVLNNFYTKNGYVEANGSEIGGDAYHLSATNSMTFTSTTKLISTDGTSFPSNMFFKAPKITLQSEILNRGTAGKNSITFYNASVNFDGATYSSSATYIGPYYFTEESSINITANSIGKTLIKATLISGAVTLDVESGVQDGDTFSIEAADNQLIITDGEWVATPSTVGNVTTYTLAKAGPSKKQRLFYTYENWQRVLRFLRSGL